MLAQVANDAGISREFRAVCADTAQTVCTARLYLET